MADFTTPHSYQLTEQQVKLIDETLKHLESKGLIPSLDEAHMARPTQSAALGLQVVGRTYRLDTVNKIIDTMQKIAIEKQRPSIVVLNGVELRCMTFKGNPSKAFFLLNNCYAPFGQVRCKLINFQADRPIAMKAVLNGLEATI